MAKTSYWQDLQCSCTCGSAGLHTSNCTGSCGPLWLMCPQLGCPANQGASYWTDWMHEVSTGGIWILSVHVYLHRDTCVFICFSTNRLSPREVREEMCPWALLVLASVLCTISICDQSCVCVHRTYVCLLGIIPFWELTSLLAGPWDTELCQFCFSEASRFKRS